MKNGIKCPIESPSERVHFYLRTSQWRDSETLLWPHFSCLLIKTNQIQHIIKSALLWGLNADVNLNHTGMSGIHLLVLLSLWRPFIALWMIYLWKKLHETRLVKHTCFLMHVCVCFSFVVVLLISCSACWISLKINILQTTLIRSGKLWWVMECN